MLVTIQLNDGDIKRLQAKANRAMGRDGVQLALADLIIALRGRTTVVDKNGNPVRKAKTKRGRTTR